MYCWHMCQCGCEKKEIWAELFLLPEEFLVGPDGVHGKTLMWMEQTTWHQLRFSCCVHLLRKLCCPVIWELLSISFLQSTFEGRNTFRFIVIGDGSGTVLSPIKDQIRLIFPFGCKFLALLFQCLLPSFLQRILCKCLQFEHDLLIHVAQSHIEYLERFAQNLNTKA